MRFISLSIAVAALSLIAGAQTPVITTGGILNGASFDKTQPVAPGSLVSIFGTELASGLSANDTVPLSTTLGGNVSVTVNGIPAGLYFVSSGQINAQIPWDVLPGGNTTGQASVIVTRNGAPSQPQMVNIAPVAPGIFYLPEMGGWAIAINSDGSLAAPLNSIPGVAAHPAKSGDGLQLLATGLGAVDSPISNGANSLDKLRRTNVTPAVLVGGKPATVLFSGLTPQFPGVNQVNFTVPDGVTGTVPLQLQASGVTTTDAVKMALQ